MIHAFFMNAGYFHLLIPLARERTIDKRGLVSGHLGAEQLVPEAEKQSVVSAQLDVMHAVKRRACQPPSHRRLDPPSGK